MGNQSENTIMFRSIHNVEKKMCNIYELATIIWDKKKNSFLSMTSMTFIINHWMNFV